MTHRQDVSWYAASAGGAHELGSPAVLLITEYMLDAGAHLRAGRVGGLLRLTEFAIALGPAMNTALQAAFGELFLDLSDEKNDRLVAIATMVPFESFRSKLKAALIKGELRASDATRKSLAGRNPWDEVMIFKIPWGGG